MNTNPIKQARQEAGLSQNQLAQMIGVSRQIVVKTENGMYRFPSTKILAALDPDGTLNLEAKYKHWQEQKRLKLVNQLIVTGDTFQQLIEDNWENINSACRALCLNPETVTRYIKRTTRRMPDEIAIALSQAGLSSYAAVRR